MATPHLPFVTFIPQRRKTDCGVATLAMLCGCSYEQALLAIRKPSVLTDGVQLRVVRDAAKKLGKKLVLHRQIDPDNDTGILGVKAESWDFEHLVILKDGLIIDPQDSGIWDFDSYMAAHGAKAVSLLALKED
jgi:hypothetical protein